MVVPHRYEIILQVEHTNPHFIEVSELLIVGRDGSTVGLCVSFIWAGGPAVQWAGPVCGRGLR